MKVVKFWGGLGNQLFQYSFFLALRKYQYNVQADLDYFEQHNAHNGYEIENIFQIKLPEVSNFQRKLFLKTNNKLKYRILRKLFDTKNRLYTENPEFYFHEDLLLNKSNAYLTGYWQHHKYIELVENELRSTLIFPKFEHTKNIDLSSLLSNNRDSVSIHIRRGDYLGHEQLGDICNIHYYRQSIAHIISKVQNPIFIFFSNDITWCKEKFSDLNAIFVDWNTGQNSFRDMQLMSLCAHNIIANSSFSWWASWFNNNPTKIIIAPKKWIKQEIGYRNALLLDSFELL